MGIGFNPDIKLKKEKHLKILSNGGVGVGFYSSMGCNPVSYGK